MKKIILSVAIVAIAFAANAQKGGDAAYEEGSSTVTLGYGFGNIWKTTFSVLALGNGGSTSSMGPFALTYEYGLTENISLGLCASMANLKNTYTDKSQQKLNQIGIVARANYHFGSSDKFDPYIGLGLGYYNFKYTATDSDGNNDPDALYVLPGAFGFSGQLGAKYYFASNIGAFAEIGYIAGGFAQAGIALKF